VSTRCASYPAWRSSFLTAVHDDARLRQLLLDYCLDLRIAPQIKHMACNYIDPSNKVACAFNLLPPDESYNEAAIVAMVMHALPLIARNICEETASHMNESLTTFLILGRHQYPR
jgi:hypothetical protein